MIDIWDFLLVGFLGYYIVLYPYCFNAEEDAGAVYRQLVHKEFSGVMPGVLSLIAYPVYAVFNLRLAILFAKFAVLVVFFDAMKSLRDAVSKEHGEEMGIMYYLITLLQPNVMINSSRLLLDNYGFIAGTFCSCFYLKKRTRGWKWMFCAWAAVEISIWMNSKAISASRVSLGSISSEINIIALIAGCISVIPLSRLLSTKGFSLESLIDIKIQNIIKISILSSALSLFLNTGYFLLPLINIISSNGLGKL